jgi:hypothetical protein
MMFSLAQSGRIVTRFFEQDPACAYKGRNNELKFSILSRLCNFARRLEKTSLTEIPYRRRLSIGEAASCNTRGSRREGIDLPLE